MSIDSRLLQKEIREYVGARIVPTKADIIGMFKARYGLNITYKEINMSLNNLVKNGELMDLYPNNKNSSNTTISQIYYIHKRLETLEEELKEKEPSLMLQSAKRLFSN